MLIINADDWGKNCSATTTILQCFRQNKITSISSMVFMTESEKSADIALEYGIDSGLHLNFSLAFNEPKGLTRLQEYQRRIARFLLRNKACVTIYDPFLCKEFDYVVKAQMEEYQRLYGRAPARVDGHQHLHLCMNVLIDKLIPKGTLMRRNHAFLKGEKGTLNRLYRSLFDVWLGRNYKTVDYFFDINPINPKRLEYIKLSAESSQVELMVHPERTNEYRFIMSQVYTNIIANVDKTTFESLLAHSVSRDTISSGKHLGGKADTRSRTAP